jgi:DNA primase
MNIFSFIKERISILDVINEYVTLKRAGGYYKGTCPFHHEKTASFTVSPDKAIFYCFGCHISGDVISFTAKIENCSQKEATHLLAERYSITIPQAISFDSSEKSTEQKNHYFFICKSVAEWCHSALIKHPHALTYFQKRGFSLDTVQTFMIGYFPSGNASISDLLYSMQQKSIIAQDLIDAAILFPGKSNLYSPFEDRLIFPIQDTLGRYCGFGGRTFKEHDTRPKYYNSRENNYFVKGTLLFNLDRAKKSIQESGKIFLVEGYTDCMAMHQHGIINTVATLGTACTLEHLKQLARYAEHLFIVYDNDTAGKQAVLRLTEMCWQVNLELKIVVLPHGEDPDSFLSKQGDMQQLIQNAQDIFIFFIETLGENFLLKPLSQKVHIARSFLSIITTIPDTLKKDILLQKAAKTFDIPFLSLKKELSQISIPIEEAPKIEQNSSISPSLLEKRIFCAIMNNIELLKRETNPVINYISSPLYDLINQLQVALSQTNSLTFSHFFDMLDNNNKHYVGKLLLEEHDIVTPPEFDKLLLQLQKKQWRSIVRDIKVKLARATQEGNSEKVSSILHDFMALQNKVLQTNNPIHDSYGITISEE